MNRFFRRHGISPCLDICGRGARSGRSRGQSRGAAFTTGTALGDIEVDDVDIDENGASFLGSVQWVPDGLFKFEGNLEYFSKGFGGGDSEAWAPQAFALLGGGLYGGPRQSA